VAKTIKPFWTQFSEKLFNNFKTFNNGSLGSGIDEERSEMRYVMWIAEFSESSNLWTHIAPFGIPKGMPVRASLSTIKLCLALIVTPPSEGRDLNWSAVVCEPLALVKTHRYSITGRKPPKPNTSRLTSDQVGIPAELKHINKRRKRNQQGLP
jgi:hypothetical protein